MYRFGLINFVALATVATAACGGPDAGEPVREPVTAADAPATSPAGVSQAVTAEIPAASAEEPNAGGPAAGGATPAPDRGAATPSAAEVEPAPTPRTAPAASESPSGAAQILELAERAYEDVRSLEADFVQEVTVPLLGSTQRSRGKVYHRRPGRFLMMFSDPAGDVVVADGRYLWMYYPSADAKQVLRSSLGEGGQQVDLQQELLRDATERYSAEKVGTEAVAGRAADVLVLSPRGASPYRRIKVWVDQGDHLVRRFEVTEDNESVRKLELRGLKPNVSLSDELFRFTPPPGTQVFQQ